MKRYNTNKYNIQGKCQVCGEPVMVDGCGNGEECLNCGWIQDSASKERPDFPTSIII